MEPFQTAPSTKHITTTNLLPFSDRFNQGASAIRPSSYATSKCHSSHCQPPNTLANTPLNYPGISRKLDIPPPLPALPALAHLVRRPFARSHLIMLAVIRHARQVCGSGARALALQAVVVPGLGDSISQGTVVSLEKRIGEAVAADDIIAILETDKVSLPSLHFPKICHWLPIIWPYDATPADKRIADMGNDTFPALLWMSHIRPLS